MKYQHILAVRSVSYHEVRGLTLVRITSREGNAKDITVFERGQANKDQGSGWDLNSDSQEALNRVGVDLSPIQRPGSDTSRFYQRSKSPSHYDLRMLAI